MIEFKLSEKTKKNDRRYIMETLGIQKSGSRLDSLLVPFEFSKTIGDFIINPYDEKITLNLELYSPNKDEKETLLNNYISPAVRIISITPEKMIGFNDEKDKDYLRIITHLDDAVLLKYKNGHRKEAILKFLYSS